jgi:hypothetical protein
MPLSGTEEASRGTRACGPSAARISFRLMTALRLFSVVSVTAINATIAIRAIWLIRHERIAPSLAMWVFFTIAVIGSLLTYLGEGRFGLLDNILNTTDALLVSSIALAVHLWGDSTTKFNRFDLACLAAVIAIVIIWVGSRQHAFTHMAIQGILVISYVPVIRRLWSTRRNSESYFVWTLMMLAPAFSLLSSEGTLATIYAVRAMFSAAVLMILMGRCD